MERTKVAIVEDHELVLAGLVRLVEGEGYVVAATAKNFKEALEKIPLSGARVVLLDFHIPGGDGILLLRELRAKMPKTMFLMLTVEEDEEIIFRALREGALGYVLKHSPPEQLLESIETCARGEFLLGAEVYAKVFNRLRKEEVLPADFLQHTPLTNREREIVELILAGKGNKEIARILKISDHTVKNHITKILRKLNLQDRMELFLLAARRRNR